MRTWRVAGGLLESRECLLLVANRRRDGRIDWSPPGGIVDPGESVLEALTRETVEETGLAVEAWQGPTWTVAVAFADMDMHLDAEVHRARRWHGELTVADPDGVVTAADFCDPATCAERLGASPPWIAEPLLGWLATPWEGTRHFAYLARGRDPRSLDTRRVEPPPVT